MPIVWHPGTHICIVSSISSLIYHFKHPRNVPEMYHSSEAEAEMRLPFATEWKKPNPSKTLICSNVASYFMCPTSILDSATKAQRGSKKFLMADDCRYGPCGFDQLVVTDTQKLVTNSAEGSEHVVRRVSLGDKKKHETMQGVPFYLPSQKCYFWGLLALRNTALMKLSRQRESWHWLNQDHRLQRPWVLQLIATATEHWLEIRRWQVLLQHMRKFSEEGSTTTWICK